MRYRNQKEDLSLFRLSHCGATIEWDLYYFIVRNFTLTGKQDLGEGEYITFEWYTKEELTQFVISGEFSEDRTK